MSVPASRFRRFQCSSASRKFLNADRGIALAFFASFSALQRAENSSITGCRRRACIAGAVSVLFSEPKIPQPSAAPPAPSPNWFQCSSASRKFLNLAKTLREQREVKFQCSSASRKFLNVGVVVEIAQMTRFSALQRAENSSIRRRPPDRATGGRFSALQRAENSSIDRNLKNRKVQALFQCSSASRKFLNAKAPHLAGVGLLFQCSSASRKFLKVRKWRGSTEKCRVSVLFSEPKIPQFERRKRVLQIADARFSALQRAENSSSAAAASHATRRSVSVLFSEPKIPQSFADLITTMLGYVSVLFSEPKIPQVRCPPDREAGCRVSVLFSEPKIPQSSLRISSAHTRRSFSALQRAENSSMAVAQCK